MLFIDSSNKTGLFDGYLVILHQNIWTEMELFIKIEIITANITMTSEATIQFVMKSKTCLNVEMKISELQQILLLGSKSK
jgi:hypothetical protein